MPQIGRFTPEMYGCDSPCRGRTHSPPLTPLRVSPRGLAFNVLRHIITSTSTNLAVSHQHFLVAWCSYLRADIVERNRKPDFVGRSDGCCLYGQPKPDLHAIGKSRLLLANNADCGKMVSDRNNTAVDVNRFSRKNRCSFIANKNRTSWRHSVPDSPRCLAGL